MRHKQIYLIMTICIALAGIAAFLFHDQTATAKQGYASPVIPLEWKEVLEHDRFSDQPTILLKDRRYSAAECPSFITEEEDVMLSAEALRTCMKTLSFSDGNGLFTLLRGTVSITFNLETDEVDNGISVYTEAGAVREIGGTYYVSASAFCQELGYSFSYDVATHEVTLIEKRSSFLPSAFSFVEIGRLPEVLNQGSFGTCWAFAPLSAAESSLLPETKTVFSRDHLVLTNSFGAYYEGGNRQAALSYLLSWTGPVEDESDIYGDGETNENLSAAYHVQGAWLMNEPSVADIKEAVYLYGGVEASIYLCMADETALSDTFRYYNEEAYAYCYFGTRSVNHDILIVGWDDSFSRKNFKNNSNIRGNGAFLCLNSWGDSFGNDGLFWVSYYDTGLAQNAMCFTSVEAADNYDHIYQTDLCGLTADVGYNDETAWFANVYTASGHEWLEAAGFYTLGEDSEYEIYLVHNFEEEGDFAERTFLKRGVIDHPGYTTVELDKPVLLSKNETYAIVVRLTTPGIAYPVGAEQRTGDVQNVNIKDGEGYISSNGKRFRRTEETLSCNVCLKAYTSDAE